MKELSIEEKVKAYDRAFEIAKAWCKLDNNDLSNDDLETLFPELKEESEDERVRNTIIRCLKGNMPDNDYRKECITWLEKQGEQKSVGEEIVEALRTEYEKGRADAFAQMQKEWSEEDEQYLLVCKNALAKYQTTDKWDADIISCWLENKLKAPQNTWKPSDEQMSATK